MGIALNISAKLAQSDKVIILVSINAATSRKPQGRARTGAQASAPEQFIFITYRPFC